MNPRSTEQVLSRTSPTMAGSSVQERRRRTFADMLAADAPRPEREDARHRRRERVLAQQRPRLAPDVAAWRRPPRPVAALVPQDPIHALREARRLRGPWRRHHGNPRRVVRRRRRPGVEELLPDLVLHRHLPSRNAAEYGPSRSCLPEQQTRPVAKKNGGLGHKEEGPMG